MTIFKKQYAFINILLAAFVICVISGTSAYASNALRELGFSARDSAMAGATTASPEDTSCLVKNPAALVWIGDRIDLMYQNILPHDVEMNVQGGAVPSANFPLNAVALPAVGERQKSTITYIPGADAGISYRIPGTDKYPISVGCGIFTISGLQTSFPEPRINTAYITPRFADYESIMDIRSMRVAPGLAVAFNDKLSFGAAANIEIQGIRSNLARAADFRETVGNANWDFTAGGGFTLGLLYKLNKMLNLGASYESHTWMGFHDRYNDIPLHFIDEPPVINVGVAFKPIKALELTYDTRYINWSNVKVAERGPMSGGFGWQDQWVFAVGGEYTFKDKKDNDKLKLRLGYNYGKSPIQPHVVFANALLPVVMEHHLTTGFSYFLWKQLSLDFVWEHHFKGVQTDNGAGDFYSATGRGTKVTAAAEVISAGLGYKF